MGGFISLQSKKSGSTGLAQIRRELLTLTTEIGLLREVEFVILSFLISI